MLFLLRCTERGKEPHAGKSKLRHDIADRLRAAVPEARLTFDVGRVYVDAPRDITSELSELHGVSSFSPCSVCDVGDLVAHVVARAELELAGGRSFRVKLRRSGEHPFSSNAKAAELGAAILARVPATRVDLRSPDVVLAIEIKDQRCFVCTKIIPGIDARPESALATAKAIDEARRTREGADGFDAPRFLVDAMLGTLASKLRALGYDTAWRRDTADSLLLREAKAEQRTLLTQDRELSEIGGAAAYFVRGKTVDDQLAEVTRRFALHPDEALFFTRCSLCNAPLEPIAKPQVERRVPPRAFEAYSEFWTCRACDKIYWKGSHYDDLRAALHGKKQRG